MGLLLGSLSAFAPSSAGQSNPPPSTDDCVLYAFTYEDNSRHFSLVQSESMVFGTKMQIVSNCGNISVYQNDFLVYLSKDSGVVEIDQGIKNVTIETDYGDYFYSNVTFITGGTLTTALMDLPTLQNPFSEKYSPNDIKEKEMIASVGTGLIIWVLVTAVMWKLIDAYVDRNYIEEVTR